MYQSIKDLLNVEQAIILILNNGFETRARRGAELIQNIGLRPKEIVLLKYPGKENEENYEIVSAIGKAIVQNPSMYHEINSNDISSLSEILARLDQDQDNVVCDITGLSRCLILSILTQIYRRNLRFSLVYTEAEEYYPRKEEFNDFLNVKDPSEAFSRLIEYEEAEIVYSSNCEIIEVPEFPGRIFPNHPVMLFAFLAFKRSRLSCILNQYETNARILLEMVPVRKDLEWREKAIEIINFDFIDQNKGNIIKLSTFDWKGTYSVLTELYSKNNNGYRFNILLAPLGSKMETVGCWFFAIKNPDVKVITSIPRRHFPVKYSVNCTDTHLIPMDFVYAEANPEVPLV
jgi:hypothetical protein